MASLQTNNILKIEVCPSNGMRKEEMIESYKEDVKKQERTGQWSYAKYTAACEPDICIGNCEKCNAWELRSEKSVYIRENNTFINHVKYELGNFMAYYLLNLPLMMIIGWFIAHNIAYGFIFSFLITMIYKFFGLYNQSFEDWLGEKYEIQSKNYEEE